MLLRWLRRLAMTPTLALALVSTARAGITLTRVLQIDPEHPTTTEPIELPADQRIARVELVSLECAVDGARAPAGIAIRVGYQGFERGRHVAWLELPDGCGLSSEHTGHAVSVRVRMALETADARSAPRATCLA